MKFQENPVISLFDGRNARTYNRCKNYVLLTKKVKKYRLPMMLRLKLK